MKGSGKKLTRKQELAIQALMTEPTHARAAAKVGVDESTIYRWLNVPEFQAAYRAARRLAFEATIATVQRLGTSAVVTLGKNLNCGHPASEIRAADAILAYAMRGIEVLDQEERLAQLEEIVKKLGK